MPISDKQFEDLKDKVNRVDQRQDETVIPALQDIQLEIKNMSFVPLKAYIESLEKQETLNKAFREELDNLKPAGKFFNALNSRWTQVLIAAILLGAVYAIANNSGKFGL